MNQNSKFKIGNLLTRCNSSKATIFVVFLLILYFSPVFAAGDQTYTFEMPLKEGQNNVQGLNNYVRMIFTYGLSLAGIAALFVIVYGGFRYTISAGGSGVKEAKTWIFGGLSGIVLLLCSWLILYTINPALISFKEPNIPIVSVEPPENPQALSPYTAGGTPMPTSPIAGSQVAGNLAQLKANELSQILTYSRGGSPTSGSTDCSGSAERMRMELGGNDPGRSSVAQLAEARASGNFSMDLNNLQPGDIIIRTASASVGGNHVGTYLGDGKVFNSTTGGFVTEDFNKFISRGTLLGINKFH